VSRRWLPKWPQEVDSLVEKIGNSQEEGVPPHASGDVASQSDDSNMDEFDSEESDPIGERLLAYPNYDEADGVYRCENPDCGWEVAFGYCNGCQTKHATGVRA